MMLLELREKQAKLVANARAKLEEIKNDTPEARAKEIEVEYDAMMAEYDRTEAVAKRQEQLGAREAQLNAPDPRRPVGEDRTTPDGKAPEYREVFTKLLRFGVAALTPEERNVLMTKRADVPEEVRAQSVGTDAAGGFLVPEEFSGEIDKQLKAWGPMWDAAIVRELSTSNGRALKWPTVDDTAKTGRIKAENAAADDDGTDDVVFAEKSLDAYVFDTGIVRIPLELLQDSFFNMESLLNELFAERLGRVANTELTTGSGTSRPHGIVTASSVGKTAAVAGAITADELLDHLHLVDPAYRASPKCRWMFNDKTLAAIRKLKDGNGAYVWQMGDMRAGEPSMIFGHPYSINQAMADIATAAKAVLFGDFSKYVVRKVTGFQVVTLRERYAESFQVGMVGFKRFDGELLNTAAVKHLLQP